ncbi:hypothetical protein EXIGLDRAFT_778267 [Exidia glandulosa HHB12029]|uniref:Uncharacterized protein n=1 Tax=Exidia glandulosa HHB12029 TaxID=1314781 RepID=A0A165CM02_EXIGL|nr:hypothetical protein EXIGLDRAFT_778267 [Exidia glandulosa HHB12029]
MTPSARCKRRIRIPLSSFVPPPRFHNHDGARPPRPPRNPPTTESSPPRYITWATASRLAVPIRLASQMSRTKRARSPAAEYEVELHSPTRRRIRFNKPRVHAKPLACAQEYSDDDHPSDDDSADSDDGMFPTIHGIDVVFENPTDPSHPQSPRATNSSESSPSPSWTPAVLPAHAPAGPRPEPLADKLRRIAREGRVEQLEPSSDGRSDAPYHGAAHRTAYEPRAAKDDPYVQNNPRLRSMIDEGRYGVYIDSGNHNIIRVADCAPDDTAVSESDSSASTPLHSTTVTRRVRVQPPPELR